MSRLSFIFAFCFGLHLLSLILHPFAHPSSHILHPFANPSSLIPHPLQGQPARKINPETLKKYIGRYALDAGIIPISTLDVFFENYELWVKPSVVKKRRLLPKSTRVFLDEVEGTSFTFNKDADGAIVSLTFVYEGASYTAPKVTLPPPALKGNTTFRLKGNSDASIVALAGSFNNWNQSQFIFSKEGDEWICRIDLEPGKHAYKFIVDGDWLLDPANPSTEDDDYGVKNSVIIVTKESGQRYHNSFEFQVSSFALKTKLETRNPKLGTGRERNEDGRTHGSGTTRRARTASRSAADASDLGQTAFHALAH